MFFSAVLCALPPPPLSTPPHPQGDLVLDQLVTGLLATPCIRRRLDQLYGKVCSNPHSNRNSKPRPNPPKPSPAPTAPTAQRIPHSSQPHLAPSRPTPPLRLSFRPSSASCSFSLSSVWWGERWEILPCGTTNHPEAGTRAAGLWFWPPRSRVCSRTPSTIRSSQTVRSSPNQGRWLRWVRGW